MPQIYLPLKALDSCHVCGAAVNLRLCGQCAERAYCSTECQKRDWRTHKATCKTDRIDLSTFYPLLACIIESAHMQASGKHPAFRHKIINAPNPNTPASDFPDGTSARVVELGKPMEMQYWTSDFSNWWPKGHTSGIRGKLSRRIMREGNVLPLVVSTCLALLSSIYSTTTTTGNARDHHRIRLRYRSSPVSDFGVVAGSARVISDDQLAYKLSDKTILKGQDPNDHYWIYFKTLKGEEVILDCNLFTFNMCLVVKTSPYATGLTASTVASFAPAWFKDRTMTRNLPRDRDLLTERRRFSVLRNDDLRAAVEQIDVRPNRETIVDDAVADVIEDFLAKVGAGPVNEYQLSICITAMLDGANAVLDATVRSDAWKTYPEVPQTGIENDPGE